MKLVQRKNRRLLLFLLSALLGNVPILPLRADPTTFTYQGRVTANGTNFNGQGLFKFALVIGVNSSSPATAEAQLTGSFVTACNVDDPGSGYITAPAVTFSG